MKDPFAEDHQKRLVAADFLRENGFETEARLIENMHLFVLASRKAAGNCGCSGQRGSLPHDVKCQVAEALHKIDPNWSKNEVIRAHKLALSWIAKPNE